MFGWKLNYGGIALMWRGGCIIRSVFLGNIKQAYDNDPDLDNLLLDKFFKAAIHDCQVSKNLRIFLNFCCVETLTLISFQKLKKSLEENYAKFAYEFDFLPLSWSLLWFWLKILISTRIKNLGGFVCSWLFDLVENRSAFKVTVRFCSCFLFLISKFECFYHFARNVLCIGNTNST